MTNSTWDVFFLTIYLGGRTRNFLSGTASCSRARRTRIRPRLCAEKLCQNWSRTRISTVSEGPKCSSGLVRWLYWRGWELRGCAWLPWSSRVGSEAGWPASDTPGSAGPPSPSRSTVEELWPDGEKTFKQSSDLVWSNVIWSNLIWSDLV